MIAKTNRCIIIDCIFSVLECGDGPIVMNASHNIVPGYYGDIILYSCHHGYWFSEHVYEKQVTCSATGEWLPSIPKGCKGRVTAHYYQSKEQLRPKCECRKALANEIKILVSLI